MSHEWEIAVTALIAFLSGIFVRIDWIGNEAGWRRGVVEGYRFARDPSDSEVDVNAIAEIIQAKVEGRV